MKRLLAIGQVTQRPLPDRQRSRELLVNLRRGQQVAPGRRQLDRQRQPIERPADRRHGPVVVAVETEVRVGRERPVHEQLNRRALRDLVLGSSGGEPERLDREQALTPDPQRRPARDEHADSRRQLEQLGHEHRRREQMLEVVDHQQQLPVT